MQKIIFKDMNPELFSITKYPDGQHSVELFKDKLNVKEPVSIKCRIKNFTDMEILLCLIAALRKYDYVIESICFAYLMGMRSDRSFTGNDCNYFRDVIAPIVNNMNIPTVYVLAPHNISNLTHINADTIKVLNLDLKDNYILFGDTSAHYILESLAISGQELNSNIGCFIKKRENSSILISIDDSTKEKLSSLNSEFPIIIIDDLCDAGGTFIAGAQYLRDACKINNPLHLFVAHGLFTAGLDRLTKHFDKIICTNSYQDIVHPRFEVIEVVL